MSPPKDAEVQACHALYCETIGHKMPLSFSVRLGWERFLHAGFSEADLRIVLKRWATKISKGTDAGVLRFSRLIGDPDTFSDDLAIAHAEQRILKKGPTPQQRAIEQLRPTVGEQPNTERVKTGREAAIKALDAMRKQLES